MVFTRVANYMEWIREVTDEEYCDPSDAAPGTTPDLEPGNCFSTELECGNFQWRCEDRSKCVSTFLLCDGKNDCLDGSDELFALCSEY